jgi:acyl-CoA thioesterase
MEGLKHDTATAPDVAKPNQLKNFAELFDNFGDWYPYWRNVEARPNNPGREAGPPVWRTWMRLNDPPSHFDAALAAARIALWMDMGPWNAVVAAHPWPQPFHGPNLDLHVQFHQLAGDADWLLVEAEAPVAREGLIGTGLKLWDENGALVASGGSTLFCRRNPNYEDELRQAEARTK